MEGLLRSGGILIFLIVVMLFLFYGMGHGDLDYFKGVLREAWDIKGMIEEWKTL